MNRKGLEGYGPNAGKWDEINLGYLVGVDEFDRRVCFRVVHLYDCMKQEPGIDHSAPQASCAFVPTEMFYSMAPMTSSVASVQSVSELSDVDLESSMRSDYNSCPLQPPSLQAC
eukprot:g30010.t1